MLFIYCLRITFQSGLALSVFHPYWQKDAEPITELDVIRVLKMELDWFLVAKHTFRTIVAHNHTHTNAQPAFQSP